MYGKCFQKMYAGSMVGAGSHVFAVWGYCIANADPESHTVDLNPVLLATVIGDSVERIKEAIVFLNSPDPDSHCEDHEGRRLLHTGGLEYFLVTHEQYRDIQNNDELRAYNREAKRRQRAKEALSSDVNDSQGKSQDPASVSVSVFASDKVTKVSFKQWTAEQFKAECEAANHDNLLTPAELVDFYEYWTEESASGRYGFSLQKTWNTRRRMKTALTMIFSKQRVEAKPRDWRGDMSTVPKLGGDK